MPYSKLLMKVIAESGYTAKYIVEECVNRGRKLDKAYLSKLQNNKVSAPSEEISRMIANICNVDERLLVIEGYIDKAPEEIREAFASIKLAASLAAVSIFENELDDSIIEQLKKEINSTPMSQFIISVIDNTKNIVSIKNNLPQVVIEENNINLNVTEPTFLLVKDNAMFPIISAGSKISLKVEGKYNNGDIVALKIKGNDDLIVRYILFNNDDVILTTLNKEYKQLTCNNKDIIILGRVIKVIKEI